MAATRQAINEIALPTLRSDLNREVVGQTHLLGTEDAQEGATAFREKRDPVQGPLTRPAITSCTKPILLHQANPAAPIRSCCTKPILHSSSQCASRKESMKAVQVTTLDGPDSLSVAEVETPAPGPEEVLIEVAYAGVTFPELLQTRGLYQIKHELPFTLGSEAAGVISAVGDGVKDLAVGDRVATIAGKGGYAEVLTAPANATVKLPDSVSLSAAAGMPMNLLTRRLRTARARTAGSRADRARPRCRQADWAPRSSRSQSRWARP